MSQDTTLTAQEHSRTELGVLSSEGTQLRRGNREVFFSLVDHPTRNKKWARRKLELGEINNPIIFLAFLKRKFRRRKAENHFSVSVVQPGFCEIS
jgi:hypothetical protein